MNITVKKPLRFNFSFAENSVVACLPASHAAWGYEKKRANHHHRWFIVRWSWSKFAIILNQVLSVTFRTDCAYSTAAKSNSSKVIYIPPTPFNDSLGTCLLLLIYSAEFTITRTNSDSKSKNKTISMVTIYYQSILSVITSIRRRCTSHAL